MSTMYQRAQNILKKTKGKTIGLFIDNANWFYPQKEFNWQISFAKLRQFLSQNYKVAILKMYLGTPLDQKHKNSFHKLIQEVKKEHYTVKTKLLKKIWIDRSKKLFKYKCNFDVEITLDIVCTIDKLDLVMLGSGDSDFLALYNFVKEHNKGFITLCFQKGAAWEIRKNYHIFLEDIKKFIVLDKKKP